MKPDEGMIRLYDRYEFFDSYLLSSWKGLTDILSPIPYKGNGLILDWKSGSLAVGGNSSLIKLWDVGYELCVSVIHIISNF